MSHATMLKQTLYPAPDLRQGLRRYKNQKKDDDPNPSPVIVSIDPGETTGWSLMQVHPEALIDPEIKILDNVEFWTHGQIGSAKGNMGDGKVARANDEISNNGYNLDVEPRGKSLGIGVSTIGESSCAAQLISLIATWPGCAIVIEDFILRSKVMDRELLSPVRITSAIDFGLWQMGMESYRQQPSEAKSTANDQRMEAWGFYVPRTGVNAGTPHSLDADRHSITWLRKCKAQGSAAAVRKSAELRAEAWPHIYGPNAPYAK